MRKTPLKRRKPLRTRSTLKPGKSLARKPIKQKPRSTENDFPESVKAVVRRRSGNRCEIRVLGVCTQHATAFHHRKLRDHGDNRAENCLHACAGCHHHVHNHSVAKSYLMGWLVRSWMDPAEIPARYGGA